MSNEMEFLGKQSFLLSSALPTRRDSRIDFENIVFGWLKRWGDNEKSSVYQGYAQVLQAEVSLMNRRHELLLTSSKQYQELQIASNKQYQEYIRIGAIEKVFNDLNKTRTEILENLIKQDKMMLDHKIFQEKSEAEHKHFMIKKAKETEKQRRKYMSQTELWLDDLEILQRQIYNIKMHETYDNENKEIIIERLEQQMIMRRDSTI